MPQFRTEIDGLGIHFLHVRSKNPDAVPLILTHGWPGSIVEFLKVIGPLTDANSDLPFHVVCPSLPGYGFSDKPTQTGWGTGITSSIAQQDPEHVIGIHLNPPIAAPDPDTFNDLTEFERASIASLKRIHENESGYANQQATRPQTLGYSLVDSPAGLAGWIVEKFRAWSDCDGHPENAFTRDELLDNLMFHWLPATGASASRLYWESFKQVEAKFAKSTSDTVDVPTGCAIFPAETPRPSRRWAAKRYTNILHWSELDKGGHFAAFEQPEVFVDEVRAFFRLVR